ncbi:septum formation initiator family protein [Beijerinckia sp. L45]|uniref:FtsB family cell division protein n=1 Tax=Beijerinckia sp. L45 TaxID=1641855 RepID=UPI00131DD2AB|nr:septum formation initiator family protein [Beijerinckia sp. L45]
MVVRTRLRGILFPLMLYCVAGGIGSYFVWHAINGERGLKTNDEYERSITMLRGEYAAVQSERAQWQHRIDLMRGETIDRDLLEEEARVLLDRVHKNDLVVFLSPRR